ncbi:peptide ABC transporter substrate-binding protein [Peribacillus deserti]|uniref:Oligopeptide ABC transporter substrate-binding protein n=1 Tax=Peribacillus deserti TaxID=673318 RepID=A0A2N5M2I2_9BACI|nr:peptide ABC transporter substrate-binding protein [Peribacillus deserti]PLT28561.1 oligopeptide ABC transporter substrate-binding protein [Peribacillus deserti]
MKKLLTLFMAALLIFSLAACTAKENAGTESNGSGKEEKGDKEKVLNLNNGTEPTSFDPAQGFDAVSWNPLNNLMEGLTRLDDTHEPKAATAEKWDVSEDGKVYTFHIRKDAKWSNGDDVKAQDFVYSWLRLMDQKTASPAAFLANFIEGAESYNSGKGKAEDVKIKAVDDKTFEVTLTSPQAYFLSVISNPCFFPINEKVAKENPKWFAEADSFVGNGPFTLASWEHDSNFVMEKNKNYWDNKTVKLDKVHWDIISDTNTEYQMFTTNKLDSSSVPPDNADQLHKEGKVKSSGQAGTYFFRFNVTKEPFTNKDIRRAFAMAVNQQDIVDFVTKNKEKPAYGFVAYGFKDANGKDFRETSGDLLKTNVEEAKKLLEKGMKDEGYSKLPEVTLHYSTSDQHKAIAEALQDMYKKNLGVDIKLANMESAVFTEEQTALKFQLSRSSFLADYSDPINFLENFTTGLAMNRTGWSNKEYDKLIKDAKNEADESKRFELMYQAEKLLMEEAPIFPLYFYNNSYLQSDKVEGIVRHPVGYMELKWADKK